MAVPGRISAGRAGLAESALLSDKKIKSTVRYLEIGVDVARTLSEQVEL